MAYFQKGNKIGNRFSSENQPKKHNGRKPSIYKQIRNLTGKMVGYELEKEDYMSVIRFLMEQPAGVLQKLAFVEVNGKTMPNPTTPVWVLSIISAINADMRYGRTSTIDSLFDRIFGKATQLIEGEIDANVTNKVDLSALSTDELIQYNALQDKMRARTEAKVEG